MAVVHQGIQKISIAAPSQNSQQLQHQLKKVTDDDEEASDDDDEEENEEEEDAVEVIEQDEEDVEEEEDGSEEEKEYELEDFQIIKTIGECIQIDKIYMYLLNQNFGKCWTLYLSLSLSILIVDV